LLNPQNPPYICLIIQNNNKMKAIQTIKKAPIQTETGITLNRNKSIYKKGGLVLPILSKNINQKDLTINNIDNFINQNKHFIKKNNVKIGIYKFPNKKTCSLDLNIIVNANQTNKALQIAKELGQESIFNLSTFENIKTGCSGQNPKQITLKEFNEIQKQLK